MRGIVIVEGQDKPDGSASTLLVDYHDRKGLIEVEEVPERNVLFVKSLLEGLQTPTGEAMVWFMVGEAEITAEQVEEVAVIGNTQVLRITLTPIQMAVMRFHFLSIFSGPASGMMRKLPPYIGGARTVVDGCFGHLNIHRKQPGLLTSLLGEELAELVLRQR